MGRITINGTMSQFSDKLTVRSTLWDAKAKKLPVGVSKPSVSMKSWKTSKPISVSCINVSATVICMLRPKRFATPFWVWAMTAVFCCKPSTNTLQASSNVWAKTAPIPPMRDYCLRRRRLAALHEYEYHVKNIPFKELKRDFIEKFVVYLSSIQRDTLRDDPPTACRVDSRPQFSVYPYKLFVVWFVVIGKGNQPGDHKSRNGGEHHREEEDPVAHQIAQKPEAMPVSITERFMIPEAKA